MLVMALSKSGNFIEVEFNSNKKTEIVWDSELK